MNTKYIIIDTDADEFTWYVKDKLDEEVLFGWEVGYYQILEVYVEETHIVDPVGKEYKLIT